MITRIAIPAVAALVAIFARAATLLVSLLALLAVFALATANLATLRRGLALHGLLRDATDGAAERFDLAFVRSLLAFGFLEHLQDFVELLEHFAQLARDVLDLGDGFADGLGGGGLKGRRRRRREMAARRLRLATRRRLAPFPCHDRNRGGRGGRGRGFVGTFLGSRGEIAFAFALVNFAFVAFLFRAVGHFWLMRLDHFAIGRVSFGQGGVTCGCGLGTC